MAVFDVPANKLISRVAAELKKNPAVKPPSWVGRVKTGTPAERPPEQRDFWYTRCASLMRAMCSREVGVRRLRHKYGGRRKHRVRRAHHMPAGGKAIRVALQQLEKAGFVARGKFGRRLSGQGAALLDRCAREALQG